VKAASSEGSATGSFDLVPLASRYETLRRAALGEPVSPEDRSGLGLFLRRGMWGWARALMVQASQQPLRHSPASPAIECHQQQRGIVQAFAAMARGFKEEKA
jgi:hypothetical protein